MAKNCPNCGTPMMGGWCPRCHPNPQRMTAYRTWATMKAISALLFVGVLLFLMLVMFFPGLFH